jgi:hypothetical protein
MLSALDRLCAPLARGFKRLIHEAFVPQTGAGCPVLPTERLHDTGHEEIEATVAAFVFGGSVEDGTR